MFTLGIIIGIYAYIIFSLGIAGLLYIKFILPLTIIFLLFIILILYSKRSQLFQCNVTLEWKSIAIILLLFFQACINLIGALGPEISFDALWYHLTLPKLYLQNHVIRFFPGGLLYYSAMPKLTEMLYTVALLLSNEIVAKLIHFLFGVFILIAIYKISRKYLDTASSLTACLIFYSNLVVGWMSITAYIDLARTFYELITFWAFLLFVEKKEYKYLFLSAVFMGLTISTKLVAVGSLAIYSLFLWKKPKHLFSFLIISLLIPLPWFVFSFLNTGNPVYPIFSGYPFSSAAHLVSPINFVRETLTLLMRSADPISPVYIIFLPLILLFFSRFKKHEKPIALYSLLGLFVWYITPRTGGGRFILPYLPVWSILVAILLSKLPFIFRKYSTVLIIVVALISIGYRGIANKKFVPVIFGKQTKEEFLTKNLNFKFGDFYDVDGYFAKTIKPTDRVLIYGIHNLYYVNFPFVHESYMQPEDWFNYVLVGEGQLPPQYANWRLIYQNNTNNVKLYALP